MPDKKLNLKIHVEAVATNEDGTPFDDFVVTKTNVGVPLSAYVQLQRILATGGSQLLDQVLAFGEAHAKAKK